MARSLTDTESLRRRDFETINYAYSIHNWLTALAESAAPASGPVLWRTVVDHHTMLSLASAAYARQLAQDPLLFFRFWLG